jgi:hypothetical protein
LTQADGGDERLEAVAFGRRDGRFAQVIVNDDDVGFRPAQCLDGLPPALKKGAKRA